MNEDALPADKHPLVDERSFALAEHFLPVDASDRDKWSLADTIQKAVEDWFDYQAMVGEAFTHFAEIRKKLCAMADETDAAIMLWGQRHPRVSASNAPTGECINYGGRRQP